MATLFTSGSDAPVAVFFHKTPPRMVTECVSPETAITSLQGGQCKYALVPTTLEVPQDLEIRATRPGWVLLQRKGQLTRSDRRSIAARFQTMDDRKPSIW